MQRLALGRCIERRCATLSDMELLDSVFLIVVIMFSAVIHEVMHGVAADKLGDPTARFAGRLTLNPIKHLDPMGSVFLPLVLAISGSPFLFGWAKPVPYNPFNLVKAPKYGEAIVALAGPLSNVALALGTALLIRAQVFPPEISQILFLVVVVNVMLAVFNMLPIPPLDGSKVLAAILPQKLQYGYNRWRSQLEFNPFLGFGLVLVVVLLMGSAIGNVVYGVAQVLVGT